MSILCSIQKRWHHYRSIGNQPNPITNATEDVEIIRTYTLDDVDVRNALTGNIKFSVFIRGSCPTGGGLQLDGVDDYVDAGNNAILNIPNAITIEAWAKPSELGRIQILNQKSNIDGTQRSLELWLQNNNRFVAAIYDGSWHTSSVGAAVIGTFYHVVGVMDGLYM